MLFEYKDILTPAEVQKCWLPKGSELFTSKYLAAHYQKVSSLENDLFRIPTQEEFFFLQSDTAFNAFTLGIISKNTILKAIHNETLLHAKVRFVGNHK